VNIILKNHTVLIGKHIFITLLNLFVTKVLEVHAHL